MTTRTSTMMTMRMAMATTTMTRATTMTRTTRTMRTSESMTSSRTTTRKPNRQRRRQQREQYRTANTRRVAREPATTTTISEANIRKRRALVETCPNRRREAATRRQETMARDSRRRAVDRISSHINRTIHRLATTVAPPTRHRAHQMRDRCEQMVAVFPTRQQHAHRMQMRHQTTIIIIVEAVNRERAVNRQRTGRMQSKALQNRLRATFGHSRPKPRHPTLRRQIIMLLLLLLLIRRLQQQQQQQLNPQRRQRQLARHRQKVNRSRRAADRATSHKVTRQQLAKNGRQLPTRVNSSK